MAILDENSRRRPRYKTLGALFLLLLAVVLALTWGQFRGAFTPVTPLTMLAARAGLVMEPGTKVTYNGVAIGRVGEITAVPAEITAVPAEIPAVGGAEVPDEVTKAKFRLDVDPRFVALIPANVHAEIKATTVFGNKYVALTAPPQPTVDRITPDHVIDATAVTTEFNTLFETITSLSEKIDPVQLNATLTALADAFDGLGAKFGQSLVDGNAILADLNPRLPQIRHDVVALADLADVYVAASPNLWSFLDNAATSAQTLHRQRSDLDSALGSAIGFGNTGADIFERGAPYLIRSAADLVVSARLLDRHSPAMFCGIRNIASAADAVRSALGNNGYSLATNSTLLGAENRYLYPDNLPRVNAKGGPGGRPGCWQEITRELWPAPWLVMDTGASIAPYNHFELGQPIVTEYVWGRQGGEDTINP
ncbi:MCE family protein [Mycolicibacterium thermoresistibile]